jgi:leader peptidase (prepilin peptidase)/N-methyltransferase
MAVTHLQSRKLAAGAAAAAIAASFALLDFPASAFASGLAVLALFIAVIDLEHFIIPDAANGVLFALGLALVATEAWPGERLAALEDALLRAAAAGGFLLALRLVHARVTGAIGLGLGDVKLAAAGAPFLSWAALPLALVLAAAGGIIAVLMRAALRGERPQRQVELPFGAFLAPAVWICFVFERSVVFLN